MGLGGGASADIFFVAAIASSSSVPAPQTTQYSMPVASDRTVSSDLPQFQQRLTIAPFRLRMNAFRETTQLYTGTQGHAIISAGYF